MAKDRRDFITKDPYNSNLLEGSINYERGKQYGELTIRKVNAKKVDYPPILGTPKIAYPFTQGGNFQFPSATEILCFQKYDGSNILAYRYWDADGRPYISYKVRLWPFLRGKLIGFWDRMVDKHPNIKGLFSANPEISGFSFEMYGNEHPHLIQYEHPLKIALLFGLKRNGDLVVNRDIEAPDIPKAELIKTIRGDYVWEYQQMQQEFAENLTLVDAENQIYDGDEGAVWYIKEKTTGLWKMFKCKPHQIELTHWHYVPLTREVLKATALNILDEHPKITLDIFRQYLAEEYPPHQIEESLPRMKKIVERLNVKEVYTDQIRELLAQHQFTPQTDTKVILRTLANHFPKGKMNEVFNELQYVLRTMQ